MAAFVTGSSLFDASGGSALQEGVGWLTGTLLGSLAVGLCVIAIAVVGLMMFGGRLPLRRGARVVLGCFVLLAAPVIAAGLAGLGSGVGAETGPQGVAMPDSRPRPDLPPSDYDPYAGASLRQD